MKRQVVMRENDFDELRHAIVEIWHASNDFDVDNPYHIGVIRKYANKALELTEEDDDEQK